MDELLRHFVSISTDGSTIKPICRWHRIDGPLSCWLARGSATTIQSNGWSDHAQVLMHAPILTFCGEVTANLAKDENQQGDSQMNGLTLLWMCLCCLRPEEVANVFPHSGQAWARAPTCCERMCLCRLLGSVKTCWEIVKKSDAGRWNMDIKVQYFNQMHRPVFIKSTVSYLYLDLSFNLYIVVLSIVWHIRWLQECFSLKRISFNLRFYLK